MKKETEGQIKYNKWMDGLYDSLTEYTTRESEFLNNQNNDLKNPNDSSQRLANIQVTLKILDELFFND